MTPIRYSLVAKLALVTALVPIVAIHLAYLVAVVAKMAPLCLPYVDGCTTISGAGRSEPSVWIFKPLMFLGSVTMAAFFVTAGRLTAIRESKFPDVIAVSGIVCASAMAMYVFALGTEGDFYRTLRRYGVSIFFGVTLLGQLLLARRLLEHPRGRMSRNTRWLVGLSSALIVLGLTSIPITHFFVNYKATENAIEWNFALLMLLNFLVARSAIIDLYEKPT